GHVLGRDWVPPIPEQSLQALELYLLFRAYASMRRGRYAFASANLLLEERAHDVHQLQIPCAFGAQGGQALGLGPRTRIQVVQNQLRMHWRRRRSSRRPGLDCLELLAPSKPVGATFFGAPPARFREDLSR